jgi:ElaB/YqjD/DUF883 family membrane-anchored ribosome-binding protein
MNESVPSPMGAGLGAGASHDPFQSAKASALKAAEELRAAAAIKASELRTAAENRAQQLRATAGQKASEFKTDLKDRTEDGQAKKQYETLMTEAENMAREKPRQALLTAFGVGVVVGLLLRR